MEVIRLKQKALVGFSCESYIIRKKALHENRKVFFVCRK